MLTFVQCTFITGLIQGQGKAGSYGKYFDTRYFQVYMLLLTDSIEFIAQLVTCRLLETHTFEKV